MKLSAATLAFSLASASAFAPSASFVRKSSCLNMGLDLSGNNWKPDSEKMGVSTVKRRVCEQYASNNVVWFIPSMFLQSTDTGDYYPEGYSKEDEAAFTDGMMGSQKGDSKRDGPELPGLANLGMDAVVRGGIEENTDIPAGMEFIPSSVPDGEYQFNVASSGSGE
jgi:hypothetical protein